jgi:hypothetical protein
LKIAVQLFNKEPEMSITKADILTRVNRRLQLQLTAGEIDTEIQETLDDLSEHDLLLDEDSSQTLVSGGETLDHPTGFRAMVALTLTITASSSEQFTLQKLKGGHRAYRDLRHNDDSLGIPRWYSDYNGKFYLWRNPNQAFTSLIEYYKDHPQDVENIEFGDMFRNTIYAGVTYRVALEYGRQRMIDTWRPIYLNALQKRIGAREEQPRIVKG